MEVRICVAGSGALLLLLSLAAPSAWTVLYAFIGGMAVAQAIPWHKFLPE